MNSFFKKNLANVITTFWIVSGLIACNQVLSGPSWIIAECLFIFALVTDALDGKIARKFWGTKAGPYLDDIADLINFGIHPALWIFSQTGQLWLAIVFWLSILYRLIRFTFLKQDTMEIFSGLPSPATALGIFGLIFIAPKTDFLIVGTIFFAFLSIWKIPYIHVIKYKKNIILKIALLTSIGLLPFLFWWTKAGIGTLHLTLIGIYILFSFIFLIPRHVFR